MTRPEQPDRLPFEEFGVEAYVDDTRGFIPIPKNVRRFVLPMLTGLVIAGLAQTTGTIDFIRRVLTPISTPDCTPSSITVPTNPGRDMTEVPIAARKQFIETRTKEFLKATFRAPVTELNWPTSFTDLGRATQPNPFIPSSFEPWGLVVDLGKVTKLIPTKVDTSVMPARPQIAAWVNLQETEPYERIVGGTEPTSQDLWRLTKATFILSDAVVVTPCVQQDEILKSALAAIRAFDKEKGLTITVDRYGHADIRVSPPVPTP